MNPKLSKLTLTTWLLGEKGLGIGGYIQDQGASCGVFSDEGTSIVTLNALRLVEFVHLTVAGLRAVRAACRP